MRLKRAYISIFIVLAMFVGLLPSSRVYADPDLKITKQPEGIELHAGEGMEFHVEAEGTNLKYQWKYQFPNTTKWDNFSGATTATLVRNSVPANWDGLAVICEISDGAGNKVTTEPVYLRIITGPRIIEQPEGVETYAGEGMEFHVEAEGTNLKYQWKYQFPNTTKWDNFSGATTATLVRNSVPANWDGLAVICEITDGAGSKVTTEPVYLWIVQNYTITYNTCDENATFPDGTTSYTTCCDGGIYYVGEGVPEPSLEGHRFIGWGDSWRNNDMVTAINVEANHIFNAIWEESCDVVYNANGGHFYNGETSQTDSSVEPGRYSIYWEEPEREGYVFVGWSSDINGTCLERTVNLTKSATFYAQWEAAYAITYDANGGEWDFGNTDENGIPEPAFTTHTEYQLGGYYWIGWEEPEREGYEFDGWSVNGNKVNRVYLNEDITVQAQWRVARARVTVTYDANDGYFPLHSNGKIRVTRWMFDDQEADDDYYVNYDTPWLDDGHRFVGWSLNPDDKDAEWGYSYNLQSDTVFYAIYIPYSEGYGYEFRYDANGGSIYDKDAGSNDHDRWVDSRVDEINLGRYWIRNYGMSRDGYEFLGWASTKQRADAGTVDYIRDDKLIIFDDTTVYAVWQKMPTITYHANGGLWEDYEWDDVRKEDVLIGTRETEVHWDRQGRWYNVGCWIENQRTVHIDDGSENGVDVTYDFDGWYDDPVGGEYVDDMQIKLKDGDDYHFYAHWVKRINITYDANGGSFRDENGDVGYEDWRGEPDDGSIHYRDERQDDEDWLDGWWPQKVDYEYGADGEVTNDIHYDFVGWSKDQAYVFDINAADPYAELIRDDDFNLLSDYGVAGTADDCITFPELEDGFCITLYAVYVPKITVIYDANGGGWDCDWGGSYVSYSESVRVHDHNYDDVLHIGELWPERVELVHDQENGLNRFIGYMFLGWSLDPDDTDAFTDWDIDIATLKTPTVRVYAIWAETIEIPIDLNGADSYYSGDYNTTYYDTDGVSENLCEGEYLSVNDLNYRYWPYREGYEFIGWSVGYTNDNGSGNGSVNGSENSNPVIFVPIYNGIHVRPGMIIRAEWSGYDYPEVHLALEGGILWGNNAGDENGVIILTPFESGAYRYSGVLYPGEIGMPNKPGYHFAGWRTENGTFPSKITVTRDISLYATWIDEEGDETFEKDNVVYKMLDDGNLEVIEYKGTAASVTIPDSINDMNITEIGAEAFMDNTTLTSIRIPNSVVSIGARAFKNCSNLNEITDGNGIRVIEEEAFSDCGDLVEFRLSDAATSIGARAFANCSSLTEFTFIFDGEEGYLGTDYDLHDLAEVVESLADDTFEGCPCWLEGTI